MQKDEVIKSICAENPKEWDFINRTLDKQTIELIVASNAGESKSIVEEFGLKDVDFDGTPLPNPDVVTRCLSALGYEASKKMWQTITKEQANALIRSMYAVGATSVKLPDGTTYKLEHIKNVWESANELKETEQEEDLGKKMEKETVQKDVSKHRPKMRL